MYTILGLAVGSTLHCSVRQQISPCTCSYDALIGQQFVNVDCEKMKSFAEVKHALSGHFASSSTRIKLRITHSQLDDLMVNDSPGFGDLNLLVSHLNISDNNLSFLRPEIFLNMGNVTFLNMADNLLTEVPVAALSHLDHLRTLSLVGNRISTLNDEDLKDTRHLDNLMMAENSLSEIGRAALPRRLHLVDKRDKEIDIYDGVELHFLEWLYVAENKLVSLDGELPSNGKLFFVNASHNALQSLPAADLRTLPYLESLYLDESDFTEAESLTDLLLGHNHLSQLNGALLPLRALPRLSLHHNELTEFDLAEMHNVVEVDTRVTELRLGHNLLEELDGFLLGLPGLRTLDLSHNRLRQLPPDELLGLEQLRFLDLSYNHLTTLAETSKKILPALETLLAGHNKLTALEQDLHGFPGLCVADLSYNQIARVGAETAKGSACLVRGVPGTLRIFLQADVVADVAPDDEEESTSTTDVEQALPLTAEYVKPVNNEATEDGTLKVGLLDIIYVTTPPAAE
ncbi:hypothetical protein B566_EDAN009109 [Ephemera danica]|nr:hypothetical protein B566_EDAN009109 [Ephemera danica]